MKRGLLEERFLRKNMLMICWHTFSVSPNIENVYSCQFFTAFKAAGQGIGPQ